MKKIFGQLYKAVGRIFLYLLFVDTINVKLKREGGLEDIGIVTFFVLKTNTITSSMIPDSHVFFPFRKLLSINVTQCLKR